MTVKEYLATSEYIIGTLRTMIDGAPLPQKAEDVSYWPSYFAEKEVSGIVGNSVKVLVTAKDSLKSPVALRPDVTITYAIDNPKIATVSADGMVTFVKKGETELIVTVTQDGFSARARVPVVAE